MSSSVFKGNNKDIRITFLTLTLILDLLILLICCFYWLYWLCTFPARSLQIDSVTVCWFECTSNLIASKVPLAKENSTVVFWCKFLPNFSQECFSSGDTIGVTRKPISSLKIWFLVHYSINLYNLFLEFSRLSQKFLQAYPFVSTQVSTLVIIYFRLITYKLIQDFVWLQISVYVWHSKHFKHGKQKTFYLGQSNQEWTK